MMMIESLSSIIVNISFSTIQSATKYNYIHTENPPGRETHVRRFSFRFFSIVLKKSYFVYTLKNIVLFDLFRSLRFLAERSFSKIVHLVKPFVL